jgi:4-hydroxybenzoate polyprenyltransferase
MTSLNIFRRVAEYGKLMRSAGRVINDYPDKDFDGHVERTRNQPLAGRAGAAVLPAGAASMA